MKVFDFFLIVKLLVVIVKEMMQHLGKLNKLFHTPLYRFFLPAYVLHLLTRYLLFSV